MRKLSFLIAPLLAIRLIAAEVPTPTEHLGYRPGADYHLAEFSTVVDYFRKVDASSDRVVVRELGQSTEGKPFIAAFVSDAKTIANLSTYQTYQKKIADPRLFKDKAERDSTVAASKPVVLITCMIHSTETASTFTAIELLHELATSDSPSMKEIRDNVILILVPAVNPDGVTKVAQWYERSKGHPWEGSGLPELYHKYAGHDTNRDWFMLNLKETQALTKLLYKEFPPTLSYDIHQMGNKGARIFVPPFFDPVNPNLDPRVNQGIFQIGAHMAADLASVGRKGVLSNAMYDNWWNGGNRTTPQRHNIVGVLTESASVNLASPIFQDKLDPRGGATRGFPNHSLAVNFTDPWTGGWWRLRDIVDDQLICCRSILTLASRYKYDFQSNYLAMGKAAIERGKSEPPFGWIVPMDQADPGRVRKMLQILMETGIEVHRAETVFTSSGRGFPAGTFILKADQPYRAHLKDMMERQIYPDRFTAGGAAEPPYDVAGWTFPLQMGVTTYVAAEPLNLATTRVESIAPSTGTIPPRSNDRLQVSNTRNDDFRLLNALLKSEASVQSGPAGLTFTDDGKSRAVLEDVLTRTYALVVPYTSSTFTEGKALHQPRIGLYQPFIPSMDEGWTRLVLEQFDFPYTTLHNADIRSGELRGETTSGVHRPKFDVIMIPSIEPKTLRQGYGPNETEPAYVGGLGREGVDALRAFVEEGGTLICFDESCAFAIESLDLPVKESLKGLKTAEFYGPGSILKLEAESHPLTVGWGKTGSAYFSKSTAFDIDPKESSVKIAARYAKSDVLESGWLLGASKIQGKAALVEVDRGRGRVVLFGFPPQHRGQPHGTFRLLFNAIYRGATSE